MPSIPFTNNSVPGDVCTTCHFLKYSTRTYLKCLPKAGKNPLIYNTYVSQNNLQYICESIDLYIGESTWLTIHMWVKLIYNTYVSQIGLQYICKSNWFTIHMSVKLTHNTYVSQMDLCTL